MQRFRLGSAALAALCLGAPAVSSQAEAQTWVVTKHKVVNLRDLDLTDPRQVTVLRQRIDRAVEYVCDVPSDTATVALTDSCRIDALTDANAQLDKVLHQVRRAVSTSLVSKGSGGY